MAEEAGVGAKGERVKEGDAALLRAKGICGGILGSIVRAGLRSLCVCLPVSAFLRLSHFLSLTCARARLFVCLLFSLYPSLIRLSPPSLSALSLSAPSLLLSYCSMCEPKTPGSVPVPQAEERQSRLGRA